MIGLNELLRTCLEPAAGPDGASPVLEACCKYLQAGALIVFEKGEDGCFRAKEGAGRGREIQRGWRVRSGDELISSVLGELPARAGERMAHLKLANSAAEYIFVAYAVKTLRPEELQLIARLWLWRLAYGETASNEIRCWEVRAKASSDIISTVQQALDHSTSIQKAVWSLLKQNDYWSDSQLSDTLQHAIQSFERLNQELAKIKSLNATELNRQPVVLKHILQEAIKSARVDAPQRKPLLLSGGNTGQILADTALLTLAFTLLFRKALQLAPGPVRVRIGQPRAASLRTKWIVGISLGAMELSTQQQASLFATLSMAGTHYETGFGALQPILGLHGAHLGLRWDKHRALITVELPKYEARRSQPAVLVRGQPAKGTATGPARKRVAVLQTRSPLSSNQPKASS